MEGIQLSKLDPAITTWQIPRFCEQQRPVADAHVQRSNLLELSRAASTEGFETGRLEGLDAGKEEMAIAVAQFLALADAMTKPFVSFDQQVVNELSKIVLAVTSQVVRQEVTTNPDIVNKLVETALSMLCSIEGDAEIFLHPCDIARVREHLTETHQQGGWRLSEDESLAQGGCRVETPVSYIDMSLQKQIDVALDQLQQSNEYELDCSAATGIGSTEQNS